MRNGNLICGLIIGATLVLILATYIRLHIDAKHKTTEYRNTKHTIHYCTEVKIRYETMEDGDCKVVYNEGIKENKYTIGWCMLIKNGWSHNRDIKINVNYCPTCGELLPRIRKVWDTTDWSKE